MQSAFSNFQAAIIRTAIILAGVCLACALPVRAAEFYVAVNGSDANLGTLAAPFASLARGQAAAAAGDTVWIRGGVYEFSGTTADIGVLFNKSGAPNQRINYWAYPGETPAFDFFNLTTVARIRGFSVRADWLHFRGLELRGVQQIITTVNESWGIRIENGADNNVFERLNLHHNEGPGLFIADGGNNLVLNSDSHHNYDPDRGGGNADGFGSHSNDPGNRFVGARAWENSDDGFDLINSPGQATIEDSWAWRNGYIPGTNSGAGNGAGFKAGGFGLDSGTFPAPQNVPTHALRGNLAFSNRTQGFYANHHPGGLEFISNTAYSNPRGFDLLADVETAMWPADHFLRNNLSYGNSTNLTNATQAVIDDEFNSWNGGVTISSADFLSLSSSGVDGPRGADGSLPSLNFLRLAPGSDLIDAGTTTGRAFSGFAPDLGALEFPMPTGDYNNNGAVDAADYTVWRDSLGASVTLPNDPTPGAVTQADYDVWAGNFGAGGLSVAAAAAAPEPGAFGLVFLSGGVWAYRQQGRKSAKTRVE